MTHSIWMSAWDVEEADPDRLIDGLLGLGIEQCRLGLAYHGGRMLLPGHRRRAVYEHASAVHFLPDWNSYGRLRPVVSDLTGAVSTFLKQCQRRRFPVQAWLVLCHNDQLGGQFPECCIENAFGEKYTYALCPAQPEVQEYVLALCQDAARLPGVSVLDVEALSFMGYQHGSLHDKCGIALCPEAVWLLSVCFCPACRPWLPDRGPVRKALSAWLKTGHPPAIEEGLRAAVRALRKRVLTKLLTQLPGVSINLRYTPDESFTGGKTALAWADLPGNVERVTLSFFGQPMDAMCRGLSQLPRTRPVGVDVGFVFHWPDCASTEEVAARVREVRKAAADGVSYYCYSLAAPYQLEWLRQAIQGIQDYEP